jgi:hypothetical protein
MSRITGDHEVPSTIPHRHVAAEQQVGWIVNGRLRGINGTSLSVCERLDRKAFRMNPSARPMETIWLGLGDENITEPIAKTSIDGI